ncbi:hypothetical protein SBF1_6380001 [Candidatus Desulfosporosinus infrequens]|uniref:Uncharacterized protein n=1 Tax=Candidatus Desulfosporosinus infrequens TaxID=2043169 RepID=A0A2U3LMQ9_9FIRM|nr:hypothetical protein SBF1_6380001 [Candidatus Desulfosporosinus infrequens]
MLRDSLELGNCPYSLDAIAGVWYNTGCKPDFLTPEKWEPKVVKKRDRQDGTFEALQVEKNWL